MNKSPLKRLFFFCLTTTLLGQIAFSQNTCPAQEFIRIENFLNKLPIPELINSDTVLLQIDSTDHVFNPSGTGDSSLTAGTYAFNKMGSTTNTILGPSIAWNYQHKVHTEVLNNLPDTQNTTVHWHGAHIPVHTDGGPHQRIPAGSTWKIDFEIMDKSATMWYHPHAMDLTYEHVQMGLSGMVYVQDPVDETDDTILVRLHEILPTAYDTTDFPIIIQTKQFRRNPVDSSRWFINRLIKDCQAYKDSFNYMVNGIISPYLEVPAQVVRLRVLNGDAKFSMNLGMSEERSNDSTSSMPFELIATDAGFMDASYTYEKLMMAPGERTEWLVDFSKYAIGDTVYLANFSSEIPPGNLGGIIPKLSQIDMPKKHNQFFNTNERLLAFVIKASDALNPVDTMQFPIALHPLETPPTHDYTKRREKTFKFGKAINPISQDSSKGKIYNINDTLMNMMFVNDVVLLDSTEIWTINNRSDISHPWHIHDIHFFVTQINIGDTLLLTPESDTLQHIFKGPLDNVLVQPGWKLDFVTTFSDFGTSIAPDSSYMFHCHILPHEDNGMMGQFVVWDGSVIDTTITVSIEELGAKEVDIKLYPNPAYDQLFLEGASTSSSRVRIYDVQGKLLGQGKYPAFDGTISIPVLGLPKGMVFVEWVTKEGRAVKKVILK